MVGLIRLSRGDRFAQDFEILSMVAEGGMGTVYAVHDHAAGEARALKLLLPELVADEKSRRRFTQEAHVASSIESPHVPQVFRGGIDPVSVTPYIVMELLSGEELRSRVQREGALPPGEALWILEQLTHALAAAHRAGIVHRDLKPENVYLHRDADGERSVKLLDFGVAKLIEGHRTSATGTGAVGSPMWMAPEQTSTGGRIAPATDVWALALLTFYILTGKLFWKAAAGHSGVTGLLREIHLDPVPSASVRARALDPNLTLPPGFDGWFEVALARDNSERFVDAGAAMAALEPILRRVSVAHATTLGFKSPLRSSPSGPIADGGIEEATTTSFEAPGPRKSSVVPDTRSPDGPEGLPRVAIRDEPESRSIPVTDAAPLASSRPRLAAAPPRRELSAAVWVILLILAGLSVSCVSAMLVWVVLEVGSP